MAVPLANSYLPTPPPSPGPINNGNRQSRNLEASSRADSIEDLENGATVPPLDLWLEAGLMKGTKRKLDSITCSTPESANAGSSRGRPALRKSHVGMRATSGGSLRSPDRFLPTRTPPDTTVHKFRANKDPQKLSPSEKLLRNDSASQDSFSPRRRFAGLSPPSLVRGAQRSLSQGRLGGPTSVTIQRASTTTATERQVSLGSAWTVGGLAPVTLGISNGRGGLIGTGTNAPLYTTPFSASFPQGGDEREKHEGRLAKALDIDRTQRVFEFAHQEDHPFPQKSIPKPKTQWKGGEWVMNLSRNECRRSPDIRVLPSAPFKVLDAPNLRDDFYCSVLAYSATSHTLAVGLGCLLYAWSEMQGVRLLDPGQEHGLWLTSVAFSSTQGCKCILAYGRSDGTLDLMSLYDQTTPDLPPLPRFEIRHPCPIASLAWKPVVTQRSSQNPITHGMLIGTEDLVVGDENGSIYYYYVEWPDSWEAGRSGWSGVMILLAKISIHTQQICGLAWSHDGSVFASGGNDNLCCLFKSSTIPQPQLRAIEVISGLNAARTPHLLSDRTQVPVIRPGGEKQRWIHGAAVKAIAFCPWRKGLVATGGGSNDKCIHFFHTPSGACLATISVAAQVTSLIWSNTRREIAATFGYAQPDHPFRIAVFSWPECKQIAAIPWEGELRALYAVAYPGGPSTIRSGENRSRTGDDVQEGCLVVAASDESVKFHEVWGAGRKVIANGEGLLGGSDILEGLEGYDKEGEIIR